MAHTSQHPDNSLVKQTRVETVISLTPYPGKIMKFNYFVAFEAYCHTLCIFCVKF